MEKQTSNLLLSKQLKNSTKRLCKKVQPSEYKVATSKWHLRCFNFSATTLEWHNVVRMVVTAIIQQAMRRAISKAVLIDR